MEAARVSEFPDFHDGDVLITLTPTKQFKLHSTTLRRCSAVFARLLDEQYAANLSSKARKERITTRFRLQLDNRNNVFLRLDVDGMGRSQPDLQTLIYNNPNGLGAEDKLQSWEWLFGLFYGKPPIFDDSSLIVLLEACVQLVTVAESVAAVESAREVVDLALLRQGQNLWISVASNPTPWTELGRRVQSPSIFKEGIVHLVGKWKDISETAKNDMNDETRNLCDRKFHQLEVAKEAIELRILGHYPAFLCRDAGTKPGRANYSNDIYMWMAICFYRQWFAQAISDGRNRASTDGGYTFYHQIGAGGTAYLNHENFMNFHKYFPMSSKACNVLESNMAIMKEEVKSFVKDILVNETNVDALGFPALNWLTCAKVGKEDFPWFVAEEVEVETGERGLFELEQQSPGGDGDVEEDFEEGM